MAEKRTKADKLERQTEQLGKRVDRYPDEIEKKPSTLAPKSDEPTVLIPIEQRIRQRAYELYEQRGRIGGHDLDDWLRAERETKLVDKLQQHYGAPAPPPSTDPLELIIWENIAYLANDKRRAEAFDTLKRTIGTRPEQIQM